MNLFVTQADINTDDVVIQYPALSTCRPHLLYNSQTETFITNLVFSHSYNVSY